MGELLQVYKPRKIEEKGRLQWIKDFYHKLAPGYNNYSPKPLTINYLAIRMVVVPKGEERTLWRLCEDSSNFDKFFWWRIKQYPPKIKEKKFKQGKLI